MNKVRRLIITLAIALLALAAVPIATAQIMVGTKGNDNIQGTSGDDVIRSKDGNDTIAGGGGSDAIYSGRGNDRIKVYSVGDKKNPDSVRCGRRVDYVTANLNDAIAGNCEHQMYPELAARAG